ncbi:MULTISPECIES: transposase [Rhodopirellula]|uniref:transposase n=1 Tax=Rhodopirellula TaxID=265488 RepID=UPI002580184A|nr:transposase [Rhodopirellula sp. UBA1907]
MPRPQRCEQFDPTEVGIVHVVQRCVRRAFLAGVDQATGQDYSFRKEWIRRRMEALASVFAVDVLSYAVMSNHIHQILRNRPDVCAQWSDKEVAIRWLRVFPGRRLEEHLAEPTENDVQMLVRDKERLAEVRLRLSDISWFMRALAEPIARMANKQDECTGRFWEGRFKAQKIVDEAGLLACSMYVDLNPVRAAMTASPESSPHTSAFDRIEARKGERIPSAAFDLKLIPTDEAGRQTRETPVETLRRERKAKRRNPTGKRIRRDEWLSPLTMSETELSTEPQVHTKGFRSSDRGFLNIRWSDYKRLLDWTAAQAIADEAAKLPERLAATLTEIGIDASMWRALVWDWQKYFGKSSCIGRPESMKADAERTGRHHHRGQVQAAACFG